MLTTTFSPANHLMHIMVQPAPKAEYRFWGRRTLAFVPHHDQVLQLNLSLYDLVCDCMRRIRDKNRSDSLCGAKTAGYTMEVQILFPRGKSWPLIRMITDLGSLEWNPTTEGDALTNTRIKWMSFTSLCRKTPRAVPYKCTYVLYDGTFGMSDQG